MKEKILQCAGYVALLAGMVTMERRLFLLALCIFGLPLNVARRAPHE